LEKIQSYLSVGKIYKHGKDSVQYRVESFKDLQVIIDHFDKYPLVSAKIVEGSLLIVEIDRITELYGKFKK
jgi:LAGLIDADG endonuclease